MSTTDIDQYFKLGLDSTNNAGEQAGLINTIRTPTDTASAQLSRVTFKVPKIGMLTGDSHINLKFTGADANKYNLNLVNGALGCIKRFRILIGNKVLTDLEEPALLENNKMYSNDTLTHLNDFEKNFIGNDLSFVTDQDSGNFQLAPNGNIEVSNTGNPKASKMVIEGAKCKTYGIPLRKLGASFLETASLPVFLLGSREMIIEITFHNDAREYAVLPSGAIAKASVSVDINNVELVSTHVMLDDETESEQIANLRDSPAQYPLTDTYVIRGVLPAGADATPATNLYRLNIQNREVHRILMATKRLVGTNVEFLANQVAEGCGDESLQVKANGLNVFDRPVTNSATIYQLLNYYNGGPSLKVPFQVFNGTLYSMTELNADVDYSDLQGAMHYVGLDFKNGNAGIQGSGTVMTSALEIDYTNTPNTGGSGKQTEQHDMLFYVSISKMLSIGASSIVVSF
jgi:hypothetical protein